jgi:hypothetical protein
MKHLCILVLMLVISFQLAGQEYVVCDKITLNTGEVYIGEIVVKTAEMVMITTKNGERYQFQMTEVVRMEKATLTKNQQNSPKRETALQTTGNFSAILEVAGGFSKADNISGLTPATQLSLVFGNRNVLGKGIFIGFGTGYNIGFIQPTSINLIPLYFRIQSNLNKQKTAPFIGMDVGYALSTNKSFGGGSLAKISAGISHKINNRSTAFAGIYGGVNSIYGNLVETNKLGTFSYRGNTSMYSLGLKAGLQF